MFQVQTQLTDVKKEIQEVNWTRKDQQTQVRKKIPIIFLRIFEFYTYSSLKANITRR